MSNKFRAAFGALFALFILRAQAVAVKFAGQTTHMALRALPHNVEAWPDTPSNDTRHRLEISQKHLDDESDDGQAFRNDTIMRVNIEREALDLSLIDLHQAFGRALPSGRPEASINEVRSNAEDMRELAYLRNDKMTAVDKRSDAEDMRELAYLRNDKMTAVNKRSDAEDMRELAYLRNNKMTAVNKRSDAEDMRELAYLRNDKMTAIDKRSDAEDMRELAYLRNDKMTAVNKRSNANDDLYSSLLNRESLALGAIERINVAHRISGKPELTEEDVKKLASNYENSAENYWKSSVNHGTFWTTDQVVGEPNFIEGGQGNGFGFVQSTYHKLHCLANLRMMLSWHITGIGSKMTDDMNVHAVHCLEYIRARELARADLNEEPIDTVDYKGMGIH